jgi:DNA polymerase/3'-5' exonuclease PolX
MIQKMNAGIATRLEEVADILEAQESNPYRVQAYRRAAVTVRNCDRPMDEIVREEGVEGLQNLPGIDQYFIGTRLALKRLGFRSHSRQRKLC